MIEILSPTKDLLREVFQNSKDGVLITPFFTDPGLQLLDDFFRSADRCEFWTRMNIFDWQAGLADLPGLCHRLKTISDKGGAVEVLVKSDLHSKAYFSRDTHRALIGSSNLTQPGFTSNLEVVVSLSDGDCLPVMNWIESSRKLMSRVTLRTLITAIDLTKDVIPPSP